MKAAITLIINKWDPISLFPYAPEDEYRSEISKIYLFIKENNGDLSGLGTRIFQIFTESFSEQVFSGTIEQCEGVASDIKEIIAK